MGLDDDVKTLLDTDWDASIIAKPEIKIQPLNPSNAVSAPYVIQANNNGLIAPRSIDNSHDERKAPFRITISANSEDNAVKYLRATKKALHEHDLTNGYYHVDGYVFDEKLKNTKLILFCSMTKLIGGNEF